MRRVLCAAAGRSRLARGDVGRRGPAAVRAMPRTSWTARPSGSRRERSRICPTSRHAGLRVVDSGSGRWSALQLCPRRERTGLAARGRCRSRRRRDHAPRRRGRPRRRDGDFPGLADDLEARDGPRIDPLYPVVWSPVPIRLSAARDARPRRLTRKAAVRLRRDGGDARHDRGEAPLARGAERARRCTRRARRPSRSSTSAASCSPASGSRSCSTRARSSSSTASSGIARSSSACATSGRGATRS